MPEGGPVLPTMAAARVPPRSPQSLTLMISEGTGCGYIFPDPAGANLRHVPAPLRALIS